MSALAGSVAGLGIVIAIMGAGIIAALNGIAAAIRKGPDQ